MMRRLAAAALAALPAACLATPPYEPPASGLGYAADGAGGTIIAPGLALHFATGPGFHFPDALTIDAHNVIVRDPAQPCDGEDGVGLLISPTPRIAATTGAPVTLNQLTATLRGPAVAQVKLDWTSQFTCAGNRPAGTSTYTVFVDGRIVRHDTLDDQHEGEFSANACACNAAVPVQGFKVSSYWAFTPAPFHTMYVLGDTIEPQPLPSDPAMPFLDTNFYVSCFDAGSYQLGVAWSKSADITGTPKIFADTTQVVFSREKTGGTVSTLDPLTWTANDAVFVERSGCKKLVDRATEHATPGLLSINGDPAGIAPSVVDGIYGGDPGGGQAGVSAPIGHSELTPTVIARQTNLINSSFAVRLRFPRAIDLLRATRSGETGAWYLLQRIDDASWIAWFRDPLMPGEAIAIDTE